MSSKTHIGFPSIFDAWKHALDIGQRRAQVITHRPDLELFEVGGNRFYLLGGAGDPRVHRRSMSRGDA